VERRGRWRRSLVAVRDVIVEVKIEIRNDDGKGSKFKVCDDSAIATNGHRSAKSRHSIFKLRRVPFCQNLVAFSHIFSNNFHQRLQFIQFDRHGAKSLFKTTLQRLFRRLFQTRQTFHPIHNRQNRQRTSPFPQTYPTSLPPSPQPIRQSHSNQIAPTSQGISPQ
jgi:hypothetical protein